MFWPVALSALDRLRPTDTFGGLTFIWCYSRLPTWSDAHGHTNFILNLLFLSEVPLHSSRNLNLASRRWHGSSSTRECLYDKNCNLT